MSHLHTTHDRKHRGPPPASCLLQVFPPWGFSCTHVCTRVCTHVQMCTHLPFYPSPYTSCSKTPSHTYLLGVVLVVFHPDESPRPTCPLLLCSLWRTKRWEAEIGEASCPGHFCQGRSVDSHLPSCRPVMNRVRASAGITPRRCCSCGPLPLEETFVMYGSVLPGIAGLCVCVCAHMHM